MTLYLYAAYYDVRSKTKFPTVRINAFIEEKRKKSRAQLLCLLWFSDSLEPVVTPLKITIKRSMKSTIRKKAKKVLLKSLLSCSMAANQTHRIPASVSIVKSKCEEPTNLLKVVFNKPGIGEKRNKFAVHCGHVFTTDEKKIRIVEWIETLRAFGADTFIYYYNMYTSQMCQLTI